MGLQVTDSGLVVNGWSLSFADIPALVSEYDRRFPATLHVEELADGVKASDFEEHDTVVFVLSVCAWGGNHHDQAGKILAANSSSRIADALRNACHVMREATGDGILQSRALERLCGLPYLQAVSYGSKHLMMLRPDVCGTLDSRVRQLGYPENSDGFRAWCADCIHAATRMDELEIPNRRRSQHSIDERWYAADIDAAVFLVMKDRFPQG